MAALSPSRSKRSLVFIGFMGAGKSKAARAARAAGLEAIDADEQLERELGAPIDAFFADAGEAEFRRREEAAVLALLERARGGAIALGGGSVLSERVREALADEVVVWLDVDANTAWERVAGSQRPLARDRDAFERLHRERRDVYESLADAVVPGYRDAVEAALPSLRALAELPAGTRLAWARSRSGSYPAFVGRGLLGAGALGRVAAHGGVAELAGRAFCITDTTVGELYAAEVGPVAATLAIDPGEEAKTLAEAERMMAELADSGMSRSDHVVALGGGVVGDLAGFCAATYQRGVPVVHLPTTLVAQVDSAYGGKTGVDLAQAKNYVGAYHLPAAVLADPRTLASLPPEELAAGFAEVVKTALIAGGALWERVRAIDELRPDDLDQVIFACAKTKLAVVAADERDGDRRQALNLGHTVGHAIETVTGYRRYRHGEAVGLGLLAALDLSGATALRAEVAELLARQRLPTELDPAVDPGAVVAATARDKKRTADGLGFVVCERPGDVVTGVSFGPDRVLAAVTDLLPR